MCTCVLVNQLERMTDITWASISVVPSAHCVHIGQPQSQGLSEGAHWVHIVSTRNCPRSPIYSPRCVKVIVSDKWLAWTKKPPHRWSAGVAAYVWSELRTKIIDKKMLLTMNRYQAHALGNVRAHRAFTHNSPLTVSRRTAAWLVLFRAKLLMLPQHPGYRPPGSASFEINCFEGGKTQTSLCFF